MTDTVMSTDLPVNDPTNPAHRLADDLRNGRIPGYAADDVRAVLTMLAASPQGEGSSADAHPPQPDALPGDMREKVARLILDFPFNINCEREVPALADAILSLIQSEKGEP